MKILDTDYFISERIKVQPISNAELNAAQEEMNRIKKIENPTLDDIKEGCVVYMDIFNNNMHDVIYIVFDSMRLPDYFYSKVNRYDRFDGNLLFMRFDKRNGYCYRTSSSFKDSFPVSLNNTVAITAVYDAKINTMKIKNCQILELEIEAIRRKLQAMNNN